MSDPHDPNDPFKPMQVDASPGAQPAMLDTSIAQGKPRKNLMMAGMAAAIVLIVTWALWPQHQYAKQAQAPAAPSHENSQAQATSASHFMQQLQSQAGGPASAGSVPTVSLHQPTVPIVPLPYQQASGAAIGGLSPEEKARQRRDLIWSSSPAVPGVHLIKESASATVGASNAVISPIQAAREALASMQPPPPAMAMPSSATTKQATSASDGFLATQQESADKGESPVQEHAAYVQPVLMQGSIIRAVTVSGIDTDLPGSITARVVSDVYDSVHASQLLIPRGSVLVGRYSSTFKVGQSRVLVAMNRLILPNGKWISLSGTPAADGQGMSGMPADVNNHFLKMFGASFVIGAASLLLPNSQQNVTINVGTSGTQTGGTVLAQSLQQTVQTLMQRNLNIPPTGTVAPGTEFDFMVAKDMLMTPYSRSH